MTMKLQNVILTWAANTFGSVAYSPRERALRLVEETIEVAQTEGLGPNDIRKIVERVYEREPGDLGEEIGSVAMTLAALAQNAGYDVETELLMQFERCLCRSQAEWDKRHSEKVDRGTAVASPWEP